MGSELSENTVYSALLDRARAGQVRLDDEAAAYHMFKACDQRLSDLREILGVAQRVRNVGGFGDFQMAKALEKKFLVQATGADNSIDAVVRKDIEAVQHLREVLSLSFKAITGKDIENANALDYTTGQVN